MPRGPRAQLRVDEAFTNACVRRAKARLSGAVFSLHQRSG
jgi:hypothetical protein